MAAAFPTGLYRIMLVVLTAGILAAALPASAAAYSDEELVAAEVEVLAGVNRMRAARDMRPLLMDERVRKVARERSRSMARLDYFGHVAPNGQDASDLMRRDGIRHFAWGEAIGWNTFGSLPYAVDWMLEWWRKSPSHYALLVSTKFNYVGVGIVETGSKLLYTIVFAQGPDRTAPVASVIGISTPASLTSVVSSSVTAATLRWTGRDRPLVVRTAGLRDFRVQRKGPDGEWRTVAWGTRATMRTFFLSSGEHQFRVRARDHAGNRSPWTRPVSIIVP